MLITAPSSSECREQQLAPQVPLKNGWNDPLRMIFWGCSREEQNEAWIQWVFTLFHNIYIIWVISRHYIRHLSFQSPGRPDFQVDLWPDHQAAFVHPNIILLGTTTWRSQNLTNPTIQTAQLFILSEELVPCSRSEHDSRPGSRNHRGLANKPPSRGSTWAKGIRRCQKSRDSLWNMASLLHLWCSLTTRNRFNVKTLWKLLVCDPPS